MVENKYVFVYGAGISGCGVAEVLAKNGEKVILFNDEHKHIDAALVVILLKNGGKFICQQNPDEYLEETGLVVISPGISIKCPLAEKAKNMGIEVISEVEEASRLYKGKWIGITGTNGKTTTTTLVGEMMKSLPVKTKVGGNIGVAISKEAEGMGAEDWLIAELSSFQLEGVSTLKPNIALILNITPDHIDRHGSMENYIMAKANIFAKQTREDLLILNNDDKTVRHLAEKTKSTVCYISRKRILGRGVFVEEGKFIIAWGGKRIVVCAVSDMKIFGSHNEENALGAIACAYFAGVSIEEIRHVLKTFEGVEHRLEYVMDVAGVPYYNDSKATNPDSTIKALESFSGHARTAKSFILYRAQRTAIRNARSELMDTVGEILKETDRDNANISNSPSAKMLQIASAASREYYLNRMIPEKMAQAHRRGDIHIHDLDFYGKTLNCVNIPLGDLLKSGFNNGHGFIRPPRRPGSATALAAIILQSSQNDMFGGQSFGFFDYDMAPYMENASEEDVFQAMEALVYNLNSMHSRAGAQVPFSSLNLGLDISENGRKVIRNLLKAYAKGLGRGENPIFPNVIFRVKKGVNMEPGDPNYDMKPLSAPLA